MKKIIRVGCQAASLLLMALYATPSFAEDANISTKPVVTSPAVNQISLIGSPQTATPTPLDQQSVANATGSVATPVTSKTAAIAAVPLRDLVIAYVDRGDQDAAETCLAQAVYFEARGESLEGQLAVAQVVLNRAASGTFPASVCEVVKQPAQFSFVRGGRLPEADKGSECWHRALAIADIALKRSVAGEIAPDVLWYHATYVSPSWDRQKTRFAQIGNHIFFS